jgi:hypothetical protein
MPKSPRFSPNPVRVVDVLAYPAVQLLDVTGPVQDHQGTSRGAPSDDAKGAPAEIPNRMLGYLAVCLQQPRPSTTVVQDVLGRPAITFVEWATENAAAFHN